MQKTFTSPFWFVVLIFIIAIFLRTYQLPLYPPGLYPDEAMNGNNALQALKENNFKVFYPENNGREGLFINIQALFIKFFGNKPWSLRLPSAIFGSLTVLGLYFLGKELFGESTGLLASFLLAVNFWHINFSRMGFRAIMAPLLLVWALYFLLKDIKDSDSKQKLGFAALGGIFFGLGFYTYIAYRVMPLLLLGLIPFFYKDKKFWFSLLTFLGVTFMVALPIGLYFLENPQNFFGRTTQISIFNSPSPFKDFGLNSLKTLGMFNFVGDWNWRHNYAGKPELFWPVGILFLSGIAIGAVGFFKNRKNKTEGLPFRISILLVAVWFLLAMLPVVISSEGLPHALRAILMVPAVMLLAGLGGTKIYSYFREHSKGAWLPLLSLGFLTVIAVNGYYSYFVAWAKNPNTPGAFTRDYVELANQLNNSPKETPKYVVVQAGGVLVNGLPMPTQTVMFLTDTYRPEEQKEKNIFYVLPQNENSIPQGSAKFYLK